MVHKYMRYIQAQIYTQCPGSEYNIVCGFKIRIVEDRNIINLAPEVLADQYRKAMAFQNRNNIRIEDYNLC